MGAVVALSVWAAIDDPGRFARPPSVGASLGLTPRRYASGEVDRQGRITKRGDPVVRTHLSEAANVLLTRINHFSALKAWGRKIAKRSGFSTPLRATSVRERHAAAAPDAPPRGADLEENLAPGMIPDQAMEPLDSRD